MHWRSRRAIRQRAIRISTTVVIYAPILFGCLLQDFGSIAGANAGNEPTLRCAVAICVCDDIVGAGRAQLNTKKRRPLFHIWKALRIRAAGVARSRSTPKRAATWRRQSSLNPWRNARTCRRRRLRRYRQRTRPCEPIAAVTQPCGTQTDGMDSRNRNRSTDSTQCADCRSCLRCQHGARSPTCRFMQWACPASRTSDRAIPPAVTNPRRSL
ncbi:hypothetical protein AK34_5607 [Burkholderia dolosa AU0158]|nr:hypothetical protein AK34_5607 [Burkholderia dolosa AU0158]VWC07660.1 hypothetical protein BDO18943_05149 [Burkholderia dolosa]